MFSIRSYMLNFCRLNKGLFFSSYISAMKAIRVEKFGPTDVLQCKSVELPVVTDSTVLVKIIAAGVNPVDTYIRQGIFGYLPELPYTPGKDGAGIVQEIGTNVTKFKVAQRVFICGRKIPKYGTYAEYSLVEEDDLFPLDDKLSFNEGAALGIAYFTAYRALVLKAKCAAGETVLIHGASGAVGLASVQIAKKLGLTVFGTAGTEKGLAAIKEAGADFMLCHKHDKYLDGIMEITEGKGVNVVIEMLANVNLNADLDLLAPNGRIAIVGSRGPVEIDPRKLMVPEHQIIGVALLSSNKDEWNEMSEAVLKGIKEGWIRPFIGKVYPIERATDAQTDIIGSSGASGKLILSVQDS